MARALPDGGRVRTIELSDKHAGFAEEWIARSDVADAAFLDADKSSYSAYLAESLRIVRRGA